MSQFTGEIIAFATAFCWTVGSQLFEAAGKRAGSAAVNLARMAFAAVFFCTTLLIVRGQAIPLDFPLRSWGWLGLSGFIGFTFGDMCLFRAFVLIGPRISMLVMSLSAPVTALIGWLTLGEVYSPLQWFGIAVTVTGVSMVVLERHGDRGLVNGRRVKTITFHGVLMAFLGMIGQAVGYVLSKVGMMNGAEMLDPVQATFIRVIAGTIGVVAVFSVLGWWPKLRAFRHDARAVALSFGGAFMGPFLGVALSLAALHYTSAGVASTIMALTPVMLIPFAYFLHKEHVSLRALAGTLIAFAGVALLIG